MKRNDGDWFPLSSDYADHDKTLFLCEVLRNETADAYPVRLMCWLRTQENTTGTFRSEATIEIVARWRGAPGALVSALRLVGIIDGLTYHNWREKGGKSIEKMLAERTRSEQRRNQGLTAVEPRTDLGKKEKEKEKEEVDGEGEAEASKDSCPEPERSPASAPPVMTFPTVGGVRQWNLLPEKLAEYAQSYPGIDALAECRAALQWCRDNPKNQKTADGMPRFLGNWIKGSQNRARIAVPATRSPTRGRAEPSAPELFAAPTGDGKPVWKEL